MRRLITSIIFLGILSLSLAQNNKIHVTVRTAVPLTSKSVYSEMPSVNCEVAHDVYFNGELLISENTPIDTRLECHKARSRNRVGSVTIYFIGVQTKNGGRVFFDDSYTKGGKLRKLRWMHGKDAVIPAGTMINVTGTYEH